MSVCFSFYLYSPFANRRQWKVCFTKGAGYWLQFKVLLINSINTESNLRKGFIFIHLLLEDYEQGVLQKELIIAPLMERFKELFSENPIGNMN